MLTENLGCFFLLPEVWGSFGGPAGGCGPGPGTGRGADAAPEAARGALRHEQAGLRRQQLALISWAW